MMQHDPQPLRFGDLACESDAVVPSKGVIAVRRRLYRMFYIIADRSLGKGLPHRPIGSGAVQLKHHIGFERIFLRVPLGIERAKRPRRALPVHLIAFLCASGE